MRDRDSVAKLARNGPPSETPSYVAALNIIAIGAKWSRLLQRSCSRIALYGRSHNISILRTEDRAVNISDSVGYLEVDATPCVVGPYL